VNPFRYTARESDAETNIQFSRHRYYDPQNGRFLSEDLINFDSQGPNLYLYVGNSPVDLTDPLGLWPIFDPIGWINGSYDMWNNYERMKQRNWVGDDKYYHCMANCQATNEGPFKGGAEAAGWISFFRTNVIGRLTEPDWKDDDVANKCGQKGGDCKKRCAHFIPPSSPGKPPFPGW
jgi:RHS repeat-associated protein